MEEADALEAEEEEEEEEETAEHRVKRMRASNAEAEAAAAAAADEPTGRAELHALLASEFATHRLDKVVSRRRATHLQHTTVTRPSFPQAEPPP